MVVQDLSLLLRVSLPVRLITFAIHFMLSLSSSVISLLLLPLPLLYVMFGCVCLFVYVCVFVRERERDVLFMPTLFLSGM